MIYYENRIRSRAYFKIKCSINSCKNILELDTARSMIAMIAAHAHSSIEETYLLYEIYNEKVKAIQSTNGCTGAGDELEHPYASPEEDILNIHHKKLSV